MASSEHIASTWNRINVAFEKKPDAGLNTTKCKARLTDGLQCNITEGDTTALVDFATVLGGDGAAPGPGFFGRTSLVSCVAMGIKLSAARADVPIEAIDVELDMDWDSRGLLGMSGAPVATTGMRLCIHVESPAPTEAVEAAVDEALKNSPWLHTFKDAQTIDPIVKITKGGGV